MPRGERRLWICTSVLLSLGLSLPVAAQLDDSCVVSALNRTAPVQADGTWVLPNVPANQGPVRVRATCVENGVSRSGQSDFFTVPANGIVEVAEILFGSSEPIPLSLVLTTPVTTLTVVGQTVQLAATATFSDGSTADLTAGATGTSYRSSNPAIATVDGSGLITAQASGRVLISALNEGALAVLQLQVVASGDTDGDGLPDDYEVTVGLDPTNPVDALDDQDEDGIATIDEFQAGLHPLRADTDGDRLLDGEEGAFGTNPLLYDSDGDQVGDGLEVLAGSNPLDQESINLGPILELLTVRPSAFMLVFNTAVGEASRRLDVIARLIDGTEIEARSRRYGTNYSSSDLSIASFGAEDGRVFAGRNGTATVTVTNGTRSDTVLVTVETFSPTALSFLSIPGFTNGVDVSGDYAYIAAGEAGLYVVDISDLTRPVITGFVDTPGNANDVRVSGLFAYVADGAAGLQIVDVADPVRPQIAGTVDTPGIATDLVVVEDLVYVADGTAGVRVIEATDPSAPILLGGIDTPGEARGIDAVDHFVVVADGLSGVRIIDVSNPSAPVIVGSTHTRPNALSRAADVAVRGRFAYVADGAGNLGGLRVIDFSIPTTPVVVGSTSDQFGLTSVALDGRFAVAADYYYTNAVPVFDIGAAPVFSAVLNFSRAPSFRDDNGNGIAVRDGVVFLVGSLSTITDNGILGNTGLHIGRYRFEGDTLGVAPQVSITSPAEGAAALERTTLAVQAAASDDFRVAFVEFLMDGVVVSRDLKAPFQATLTVPTTGTSFRLGARATDLGGNEGEAEEVVVTIIPDSKPVVTLLSPVADVRIVEGTSVSIAAAASDDMQVASVDLRVNGISRRVATSPPYRVDVPVAVGATQIIVEAIAKDNLGQTATTGPLVFTVADDPPPIVVIAAPGEGAQIVQGSTTRVTVAASDDRGVSQVRLFVDGQAGPTDGSAPYEFTLTVPSSGSEVRLSAQAMDVLGQIATSPEIVLTLVPDPGTTVTGSVVSTDGQPVAGATVLCRGVAATSGENGMFTMADVPTLNDISCLATYTGPQGTPFSGTSVLVPPVPEGITDVGPIVLTDSVFEVDNLGKNLNLRDDEARSINLPFAFSIFGRTYTRVFVHANGLLTFGAAIANDHTETRTEFISGDHLGWPNVGPTIAAFWDHLYPLISSTNIGEADYYRFSGNQGDTIVAEVIAQRQGSSLDSILKLFPAQFQLLTFNDDFYGLDSRIEHALPATGTYYLSVEDLNKWGGPTYSYQLLLQANGAPLRDAGTEVEPNDFITTATPIAYGDRISGNIRALSSNTPKNVFVNDKLSGKLVVTWNRVLEYAPFAASSNTTQVILFSDGHIQIRYDGMTADDGLVGISPSTNGAAMEVDFSEDAPFSAGPEVAVFEEFDGPVSPVGSGDDPPGDRPFDLDGRILIFFPNATGGYDVRLVGSPE